MNQDIFKSIDNTGSGETVPANYFENFRSKMKASLPERNWDDETSSQAQAEKKSFWYKIRPYTYMAAMFCGIWLMMNIFDLTRGLRPDSIESNPELLAAIQNDYFLSDYVDQAMYNDCELYDELYESGFDPSSIIN